MVEEIISIINNSEQFKDMIEEDKTFSDSIQTLINAANDGDKHFAEVVVNMVYSFQIIYESLISTVVEYGDFETIKAVNNTIVNLMRNNCED